MNTAAATTSRYSLGQPVEVLKHDFETPGFPIVWTAGTVTTVEVDDKGMTSLMVVTVDGRFSPQIVGKRGGNRNLRAA